MKVDFTYFTHLLFFLIFCIILTFVFLMLFTLKRRHKDGHVVKFFFNLSFRKAILLSSATLHLFISIFLILTISKFDISLYLFILFLSALFIFFSFSIKLISCEILYFILEIFLVYFVSLLFEYINNIYYILAVNVLAVLLCFVIVLLICYSYIRKIELILKS